MLGSLSEMFGRNFILGYLLPAAVFAGASLLLADGYGLLTLAQVLAFCERSTGLATLLGPALLWLWAASLLAANHQIIRAKEGYFLRKLFPHWIPGKQRRRLTRLRSDLAAGGDTARKAQERLAIHFPVRREAMIQAGDRPLEDELLLPTSFGNIVRAFELYPREMYGFEATCGWSRLMAVLPKEYRELIENAKAEVDFLVNLWLLSWLFLVEYAFFAWRIGRLESEWLALGAGLSIVLSARSSLSAAARWGETVKGAFDVFLPALRRQLGWEASDRVQERRMWVAFSHAFLTRTPQALPPLGRDKEPGARAA